MAALAVQDGSIGFANAAGTAASAGGDTIDTAQTAAGGWQRPVVLVVRNGDATATNVTVGSLAAVSVPATTGVAVIPVLVGQSGVPVPVTYSKVTSLTVNAVRLTSPLG
jgi:hypothetical protein